MNVHLNLTSNMQQKLKTKKRNLRKKETWYIGHSLIGYIIRIESCNTDNT